MEPELLYERMALIRAFEETTLSLFSQGRLSGTTHACIGQEAVAVALGASLTDEDYLFCPHRCHGHFLAYGGSPEALLAEMMGRETGVCRGRGGSQHLHYRRFFSNGIQGGIVGNAVGAALAQTLAGGRGVAVAVLGDGTLGEGLVYESLNFAALRCLPVLFVVEHNHYAQSTPTALALSGSMTARAQAFGVAADEVDTQDVAALHDLFKRRVADMRAQPAPFFQVVHTHRFAAHSKGDDTRDPEEVRACWRHDPLLLLGGPVSEERRDAALKCARERIAQWVMTVDAAPLAAVASREPSAVAGIGHPEPLVDAPRTFVQCLNRALHELLEKEPSALFMGEDVLDPYGGAFGVSRGLSSAFPGRVITTPISEAGIVAWGVGASLAGLRPVVEIMFGDFLSLAADQLLNHAAKYRWLGNNRFETPLVVRTPMGGGRGYGPTHSQSLEKMFLGIPGLTVVAANGIIDPGALLLRAALQHPEPTLFIEHKLLYPATVVPVTEGRLGDFYCHFSSSMFPTAYLSLTNFEPADVVLYCYGGMVGKALEAATQLLMDHEIATEVVAPTLLSPMPEAELLRPLTGGQMALTVEEAPAGAGWGAEALALLAAAPAAVSPRCFARVTAADTPVPAARHLEDETLPDARHIVDAVLRKYL